MKLKLVLLPQAIAVCRLDRKQPLPSRAIEHSMFASVTATPEELSIVCDESAVPPEAKASKGWRALKVEGELDLSMTGVISSLTVPLADAGISVFTVSTYDTDYLLVRAENLDQTIKILSASFLIEGS